jgi:predicted Zn-dependent peptidase
MALRAGSLIACLAIACSPARVPLPPAPPARSPAQLERWQTPPPLATEPEVVVEWISEHRRLQSGLALNVISRPGSTLTAIALWMPSAADRGAGPIAVMIEALRAGTRTREGRLAIDPKLAQQPIATRTSGTGSVLGWAVLPRDSRLALERFADFVAFPAFDPHETRVVLEQKLAAIQRDSLSPRQLLNLARDAVPGIDLSTPERDARGLFRLTPELLARIHGCVVSPRGAELVVVGPASTAELMDSATRAFAPFLPPPSDPACAEWTPPMAARESPESGQLELTIVHGGTFDPTVAMAVAGPSPRARDFLPFSLLAQVLDGRDAAVAGLRHQGATYGIHTRVNESFPSRSLLELQGQVAPDNAQSAVRKLVEDMHGLSETLAERELEEVKRRTRQAFINSLSTNVGIAEQTLVALRRGRPAESIKRLPDEIAQVSLARCRDVARRWLARAKPSIAVAGLPVKLIRGLGLGANVRRLDWSDRVQGPKKAL